MMFVLFEQFHLAELLGKEPYDSWAEDDVRMVIRECYKFVCDVIGPLNRSGDEEGCRVDNGRACTPKGFKEAWGKLYEAGWKALGVHHEYDGQGAPRAVTMIAEEMLSGANPAFNMYPGLALGVGELIEAFGTAEQKALLLHKLYHGEWGGTMCLTEPQAGSDVGAARTRATRNADGTYSLSGTKIFITGGDHDIVDCIVHLVLARVEGAPAGTKGLSLFIVPSVRINQDGSLGEPNDVALGGLEHKMGIKGSTTCVLNFGENGACHGHVVGGVENAGMAQMFKMMNTARIAVGIQGLATASTAYLNALAYARERKQGPSIRNFKDPNAPKVPIVEHGDVRRMLLDMKSRVEGIRALVVKLAMHQDLAAIHSGRDESLAADHMGQVEILTPMLKAYASDQSFRVCETAIQTLGGAGYISDYGIEQYCRDAKIFSIYEGTNHIQAMDLVSRKLSLRGGADLKKFLVDIAKFAKRHEGHPVLKESVGDLLKAQQAVAAAVTRLSGWMQSGKLEMVPLFANSFLEAMAEATVGWLLLEAAAIAHERLETLDKADPDATFYQGKVASGVYFARNVLPCVVNKANVMNNADDSALTIPDAAFATV
jgi:alkylation response protein AidB-like acyl-CoA dehydrogenase